LAGRQLALADIVEQKRLHAVELGAALAIELVLDHVQKQAMKPFDQAQGLQILASEIFTRRGLPRTYFFQYCTHDTASGSVGASRPIEIPELTGKLHEQIKSCANRHTK